MRAQKTMELGLAACLAVLSLIEPSRASEPTESSNLVTLAKTPSNRDGMLLCAGLDWTFAPNQATRPVDRRLSIAHVKPSPKPKPEAMGKELFTRTWQINDPRGHGGDGIGPVFNERSCVACHSLGGTGGAGKANKNIDILTVRPIAIAEESKNIQEDRDFLKSLHPTLTLSGSIVLHKFSVNPGFAEWRKQMLPVENRVVNPSRVRPDDTETARDRRFQPGISQRNSTALFGSGLIDQLDDAAIEREAERQAWQKLPTKGRVARQADGRIGRFGWKGQMASLNNFVVNACAVELGLETPTRHQALDPFDSGAPAKGLDLTESDCNALVRYVRSLPSPVEVNPQGHALGLRTFREIGCADCHRPDLGSISGIYSDLLLHDIGVDLSGSGSYGAPSCVRPAPVPDPSPNSEPTPGEWRTPPLWGVADSAPYLHDGRARTLAEAIQFHGAQAGPSAQRFLSLEETKRKQVLNFLLSLKAPRQ